METAERQLHHQQLPKKLQLKVNIKHFLFGCGQQDPLLYFLWPRSSNGPSLTDLLRNIHFSVTVAAPGHQSSTSNVKKDHREATGE